MAAVCSDRDEFNSLMRWHQEKMQSPEAKYSFSKAFIDLTVVGTIYQMSADFGHLARDDRAFELLASNRDFAEGYSGDRMQEDLRKDRTDRKISNFVRIVFMGSLLALIALPFSSLYAVGCVGSAGYFMYKAGFANYERRPSPSINDFQQQMA